MTDVWSGGVAFSYFENPGDPGFGVTTGDDNAATLTTNGDFTRLQAVLAAVPAPPNTPSQATAAASNFPACPAAGASLDASSSLPPTPNNQLCACAVNNAFSCNPRTSTTPATVGALLDYGCSLLGQSGGNCNIITSNGVSGTYGNLSYCSPAQKLGCTFFICLSPLDRAFTWTEQNTSRHLHRVLQLAEPAIHCLQVSTWHEQANQPTTR
jgi:hypothetical protein